MDGKTRDELGSLSKERPVQIVVNDDRAYSTTRTRITRIDENGQEWIKLNGKYWKYPEQVDY